MSERDGMMLGIIFILVCLFGAFLAYTYLKSIIRLILLLIEDWKKKRKDK